MLSDELPALPELLIVGPTDSCRVKSFAETAHRMGAPSVSIVTYVDLIRGNYKPPSPGTLIRLESPGGCLQTTRVLLKAGISAMEADRGVPISAAEIDLLDDSRGEMLHPRQWFLGFREVLNNLNATWDGLDLSWMSTTQSILTMFDKLACLQLWSQANLPIPRQYPEAITYSHIRRAIPDRHSRIFVKLRYGYSAMGAVALEWRGDQVRAITTMETDWANGRPRLFLTKRPRQLRREFEIAWLIDTLGMEQIVVEDWLPKARWAGRPYDLRVLMINGEVHHVVGRANASPFTNLNLGALRMSREVVQQQIGDRWPELNSLCESAITVLPEAKMLGLDVLVGPGCRSFKLLEANAFGDYLPGLLHQGQTTYETQLQTHQLLSTGLCG